MSSAEEAAPFGLCLALTLTNARRASSTSTASDTTVRAMLRAVSPCACASTRINSRNGATAEAGCGLTQSPLPPRRKPAVVRMHRGRPTPVRGAKQTRRRRGREAQAAVESMARPGRRPVTSKDLLSGGYPARPEGRPFCRRADTPPSCDWIDLVIGAIVEGPPTSTSGSSRGLEAGLRRGKLCGASFLGAARTKETRQAEATAGLSSLRDSRLYPRAR